MRVALFQAVFLNVVFLPFVIRSSSATRFYVPVMKYNRFIKNSTLVSEIGVGAWQLGDHSDWQTMSEQEAIELVHEALHLGVNFFDTAPNYGLGSSELRLGKALRDTPRDKIVVNSKFGHQSSGELNFDPGLIRESVEGSLRRLQFDYLDSVILHNPPREYLDGNTSPHYEIFEQLKEEGKIKAYGASVDTLEDMLVVLNTTNSEVIEAYFNIFHQEVSEAFDLALEKDVAIIAKIPLDSGWLSGKYDEHSTFTDIRSRWLKEDIRTRAGLVEELRSLIGKDRELAQTAIAFCAYYDAVSTVIPGNSSIRQLTQNVESIRHPLHDELIEQLETFSQDNVQALNLPW